MIGKYLIFIGFSKAHEFTFKRINVISVVTHIASSQEAENVMSPVTRNYTYHSQTKFIIDIDLLHPFI